MRDLLKSLWGYRGFVLGSVQREFQSKYRNSLLGAAWNIINPLAMIVVYTVTVFTEAGATDTQVGVVGTLDFGVEQVFLTFIFS